MTSTESKPVEKKTGTKRKTKAEKEAERLAAIDKKIDDNEKLAQETRREIKAAYRYAFDHIDKWLDMLELSNWDDAMFKSCAMEIQEVKNMPQIKEEERRMQKLVMEMFASNYDYLVTVAMQRKV